MANPAQTHITVAEYYQMAADGILHEDDRVELIEGELHRMSPIGSPHAAAVEFLAVTFHQALGQRALARTQNPVHLDDYNEPQPDLSVARWRADYYKAGHPTPADLPLLVEVSDTTLQEDRQMKAPLYARHGFPELWIVNLPQNQVEVYTQLQGGRHQRRVLYQRGAHVAPGAFPDLLIPVDDILG